jgi:hypothetical protein
MVDEPSSSEQQPALPSREGLLPSASEYSYNTFRRKFAAFVGIEFDPKQLLPKSIYTDNNIAAFLDEESKKCNFVVSSKMILESDEHYLLFFKIYFSHIH